MPVSKSIPPDLPNVLADIAPETLAQTIQKGLTTGGDYCDVYIESRFALSVMLEEGLIKETSEHRQLGAGVRVMDGAIAGYAYTNDLTPEGLSEAARTAAAVAKRSPPFRKPLTFRLRRRWTMCMIGAIPGIWRTWNPRSTWSSGPKPPPWPMTGRVDKVQVSLADSMQWVLMADSTGRLALDSRPQMRLSVSAMAQDGQSAPLGPRLGGRSGWHGPFCGCRNTQRPWAARPPKRPSPC